MLFQPYKRCSRHSIHVLLPLQGCWVSGKHWEGRIWHCCPIDTAKKGDVNAFLLHHICGKQTLAWRAQRKQQRPKRWQKVKGRVNLFVKCMCINTWAHPCSRLVFYDFFSVSSSPLQSHSGVRHIQFAQLWGGKITPSSFWSSGQTWEGVKNSPLSPAIVHNSHLPHTMYNNGKGEWTNLFPLLYKNLIPCDIEFFSSISKWLSFNDNK